AYQAYVLGAMTRCDVPQPVWRHLRRDVSGCPLRTAPEHMDERQTGIQVFGYRGATRTSTPGEVAVLRGLSGSSAMQDEMAVVTSTLSLHMRNCW
ncbi:MAG: hypothetical protein M3Z20_01275, partial [Chloroflexota bacterium]|nr:hypothetical protein [Chloroflexota bacterium]